MKPTVSLSIPTYNRFQMLLECIDKVDYDTRLKEICISDDCSTDGSFDRMEMYIQDTMAAGRIFPEIHLHQNERNLNCYFNKFQAVKKATSEWCILIDDDNIIPKSYLDVLWEMESWDPNVMYLPDFAEPKFDYTSFAGLVVTRKNVAQLLERKHFSMLLNTCNYFFHRASYIKVWDGSLEPHTADTIFHAYNWLRNGGALKVVPGLRYFHRIHADSHYMREKHNTNGFDREIEKKLKELR